MLSRPQRLRRSSDIQRVYQTGRKSYHPFFRLISAPSLTTISRFTAVVSLRVSKKATERNRLKRQLRAIWRELTPLFSHSVDCVLIVQAAARTHTSHELRQALLPLLKKQHLLSR